jgi:ring-1,2-phenylacetyl-CoA epoxidase subunit PaaD
MNTLTITQEAIWAALAEVPDPELPVVNLVELGIVRRVDIDSGAVRITITPTFAGCPAYEVMGEQIRAAVHELGIEDVSVAVTHTPPWTSEWITEAARVKLKATGLAPPPRHAGDFTNALLLPVSCPRCDSMDTQLQNSFGSTPCRMIFTCKECLEPFEQFKPL